MTVREMAAWLATFEDQDAIVHVLDHNSSGSYYAQGGTCQEVEFDPEVHTEYTDMRGNLFVSPDAPYYNRRTLMIGRSE
jgi:hypothetical protein